MELNKRLEKSINSFNNINHILEKKFNDNNTKHYLKKNYGKLYVEYNNIIEKHKKSLETEKITNKIKKIEGLILKLKNIENNINILIKKELEMILEINTSLSEISILIKDSNKLINKVNEIYIADDKLYSKKEEIKKMYKKATCFDKDNYNDLIRSINELKILNKFLIIYYKEIENN